VGQVFGESDYSGGELFDRYCAACHGASGVGDGPVAASLIKQVPDLTRLAERRGGRFPRGEVRDIVDGRSPVLAHGTQQMPVWGREFWVEQGEDIEAERRARSMIDRLIDYLETIQLADAGRR
jgi:mono/diheme cytochrome c family protein